MDARFKCLLYFRSIDNRQKSLGKYRHRYPSRMIDTNRFFDIWSAISAIQTVFAKYLFAILSAVKCCIENTLHSKIFSVHLFYSSYAMIKVMHAPINPVKKTLSTLNTFGIKICSSWIPLLEDSLKEFMQKFLFRFHIAKNLAEMKFFEKCWTWVPICTFAQKK